MSCEPESWGVEQAAEFLRVSPESLLFLDEIGCGPPSRGVGWFIQYDPDQVRQWLWSSGKPFGAKYGPSRKRKSDD